MNLAAFLGVAACGNSSGDAAIASHSCDPLTPARVILGTILGVGENSQSTLFVGEEAPDNGEDRVFVSKGDTLLRKYVVGSGSAGNEGARNNTDYTFSFQDSRSDASGAAALLIQVRGRAVTAVALGPADSRSFYAPDAGDTLLNVVDASALAHLRIQNLPDQIEYVSDVSNGEKIVVTEPMDITDNAFRLFYGTTSRMVEYPIVTFNREDTRDDLSFVVGTTTYTAHFALVSSLFSGDAGLGPSSLDTGAGGTLPMTQRLPTPTSLSGFSFTCLGS